MTGIERALFIGSKALGLKVAQEMYATASNSFLGVVTIDDSNDTRSVLQEFRSFAHETKCSLHLAENGKHAGQLIAELKPDLCIVAGWYWLLNEATLSAAPRGFIGIHNSLLPKLRGGAPLVWSIILGHKEAGVSFFSFTPGMDDGPLWAQGSVPIEENDYVGDVLAKLEEKTINLFKKNYPSILSDAVSPKAQDHSQATYCAMRQPLDGNIDWTWPAKAVHNFIRAQSHPYPGAFTFLDGDRLTIWRARLFEFEYTGTPGQVARRTEEGVVVICGDNRAIILEEVERNDKKKGSACDLIRSVNGRMMRPTKEQLRERELWECYLRDFGI